MPRQRGRPSRTEASGGPPRDNANRRSAKQRRSPRETQRQPEWTFPAHGKLSSVGGVPLFPGFDMNDPTWILLRQAREALKNGQPEEAHRLLNRLIKLGHKRSWELTLQVVRAYIERGELHLRQDDVEAAWHDLLRAETLGTTDPLTGRLRQALTRLGLAEVRALLETGRPMPAIEAIQRLRDRTVRLPELVPLEEAAQEWIMAQEMADHGDFTLARLSIERIRRRISFLPSGLDQFQAELDRRQASFEQALPNVEKALANKEWREALKWLEQVITAAPQHREALQLRTRTWQMLQPETVLLRASPLSARTVRESAPAVIIAAQNGIDPLVDMGNTLNAPTHAPQTQRLNADVSVASAVDASASDSTTSQTRYQSTEASPTSLHQEESPPTPLPAPEGLPKRFLLWIDGVAGFLVCLAPRVTLGQATADGPIDVPLFADVSRLHATIFRDEEGYSFEASKDAQINGKPLAQAILQSGDRITLGKACQLLFRLPLPGTLTARLDVVSGHRLPLAVDSVLLMADQLLLGPSPQVHVELSPGTPRIVLYRHKEGLGIRCGQDFYVDGRKCSGSILLPAQACVTGEHFAFAIEPVIGK